VDDDRSNALDAITKERKIQNDRLHKNKNTNSGLHNKDNKSK
jgi:hypothetical protein